LPPQDKARKKKDSRAVLAVACEDCFFSSAHVQGQPHATASNELQDDAHPKRERRLQSRCSGVFWRFRRRGSSSTSMITFSLAVCCEEGGTCAVLLLLEYKQGQGGGTTVLAVWCAHRVPGSEAKLRSLRATAEHHTPTLPNTPHHTQMKRSIQRCTHFFQADSVDTSPQASHSPFSVY